MTRKLIVFASDVNNLSLFWSPWLVRVPTNVSAAKLNAAGARPTLLQDAAMEDPTRW